MYIYSSDKLLKRIRDFGGTIIPCDTLPPQLNGYASSALEDNFMRLTTFGLRQDEQAKSTEYVNDGIILTPSGYLHGRWGDPISWLATGTLYSRDGICMMFPGGEIYFDPEQDFSLTGFNVFGETEQEYLARLRGPMFGNDLTMCMIKRLGLELPDVTRGLFPATFGLMPICRSIDDGLPVIALVDPTEATDLALFTHVKCESSSPYRIGLGELTFFPVPMSVVATWMGQTYAELVSSLIANLAVFIKKENKYSEMLRNGPCGESMRFDADEAIRIKNLLFEITAWVRDSRHLPALEFSAKEHFFVHHPCDGRNLAYSAHNREVLERILKLRHQFDEAASCQKRALADWSANRIAFSIENVLMRDFDTIAGFLET